MSRGHRRPARPGAQRQTVERTLENIAKVATGIRSAIHGGVFDAAFVKQVGLPAFLLRRFS